MVVTLAPVLHELLSPDPSCVSPKLTWHTAEVIVPHSAEPNFRFQTTSSLIFKHIYIHMFPLHSIAPLSSSSMPRCDQKNQNTLKRLFLNLWICVRSYKEGHHLSRVFHMMPFSPARYSLRGYCTIREISHCVWTNGTAKQWAAEQSGRLSVFP